MRSWLALILAPSIVLAAQSVMYALVTPSCAQQTRVALHVVAAVGLGVVAVLGVLAWTQWSVRAGEAGQGGPDSDTGQPANTRRFVAAVATAVAALSCLVMIAMWLGVWVLWPCGQN